MVRIISFVVSLIGFLVWVEFLWISVIEIRSEKHMIKSTGFLFVEGGELLCEKFFMAPFWLEVVLPEKLIIFLGIILYKPLFIRKIVKENQWFEANFNIYDEKVFYV